MAGVLPSRCHWTFFYFYFLGRIQPDFITGVIFLHYLRCDKIIYFRLRSQSRKKLFFCLIKEKKKTSDELREVKLLAALLYTWLLKTRLHPFIFWLISLNKKSVISVINQHVVINRKFKPVEYICSQSVSWVVSVSSNQIGRVNLVTEISRFELQLRNCRRRKVGSRCHVTCVSHGKSRPGSTDKTLECRSSYSLRRYV